MRLPRWASVGLVCLAFAGCGGGAQQKPCVAEDVRKAA